MTSRLHFFGHKPRMAGLLEKLRSAVGRRRVDMDWDPSGMPRAPDVNLRRSRSSSLPIGASVNDLLVGSGDQPAHAPTLSSPLSGPPNPGKGTVLASTPEVAEAPRPVSAPKASCLVWQFASYTSFFLSL